MVWSAAALSASQTVLSGKRKHGSSTVQPTDLLCTINSSSAASSSPSDVPLLLPTHSYAVLAGIRGQLLEVNDRLLTTPALLSDAKSAQWEGHVAVVLMDRKQRHDIASSTHSLYKTKVQWQQLRGPLTPPSASLSASPALDEEG